MKLIFLGPPGAGKGTMAALLQKELNIPQISTGDMLRHNIKENTALGLEAKNYIDKGQLVPDDVVIRMVEERLKEADCQNGYMLDGFPRTVPQAEALDKIVDIDLVLSLEIDEEVILSRISGRRVCPSCKATYHISWLKGSHTCEHCGTELIQRADDKEDTVRDRLHVYHNQTEPLIAHYQKLGKLRSVNVNGPVEECFALLMKEIGDKA